MAMIKGYVSNIDQELAAFDRTHALSKSQQAEIKKYQAIYKKRDQAVPKDTQKDIWQF